jgi:anti-anti-sigma factor
MTEPPETPDFLRDPVQVQLIRAPEDVRVVVSGEIDLATAPRVEERLRMARRGQGGNCLVLDLRGVTFMDSTGLRLLMQLLDDAEQHRYAVTIVRPPPSVLRVIEISGLDRLLPLVDEPTERASAP